VPIAAGQYYLLSKGDPMMDDICRYMLSVIFTSMICGILLNSLREGGAKALTKTVCGLILSVTVISPLRNVSFEIPEGIPSFRDSAVFAAEEGEALAQDTMKRVIKSKAEAYILEKAAQWDADIQIEVELGLESPYAPVSAKITGEISSQARSAIEDLLANQFEIPKEAQMWTP
jgi:hypothetical protein